MPDHLSASEPQTQTEPNLSTEGPADFGFLDDLVAANRFKIFLIGRGIDVPENVLRGLGRLSSEFRKDIEDFTVFSDFQKNRETSLSKRIIVGD